MSLCSFHTRQRKLQKNTGINIILVCIYLLISKRYSITTTTTTLTLFFCREMRCCVVSWVCSLLQYKKIIACFSHFHIDMIISSYRQQKKKEHKGYFFKKREKDSILCLLCEVVHFYWKNWTEPHMLKYLP